MDLFEQITRLTQELDASIRLLGTNGEKLAEAERDYKMELAKKSLELRASGMAVTLIDKTVYGEKDVADKRFRRDVAEVMYKQNTEYINTTKLKLRLLEAQLSREWGA